MSSLNRTTILFVIVVMEVNSLFKSNDGSMEYRIGGLQLIFTIPQMIPGFQLYPNSMIPLASVYNLGGQPYYHPLQLFNYSYFENHGFPPFQITPHPTPTPQTPFSPQTDPTNSLENSQKSGKSRYSTQNNLSDFTKKRNNTRLVKDSQLAREREHPEGVQNSLRPCKTRTSKVAQNRNRNIVPSIVQQIFSYLSKPNKSRGAVEKVFQNVPKSGSVPFSVRRYFYFIKHIKERLNHYLNTNSMSILWKVQTQFLEVVPEEEQLFYLKVARRVAKHFLENLLPLLIIHSKRMFEDKRAEHLRVRRILLAALHRFD